MVVLFPLTVDYPHTETWSLKWWHRRMIRTQLGNMKGRMNWGRKLTVAAFSKNGVTRDPSHPLLRSVWWNRVCNPSMWEAMVWVQWIQSCAVDTKCDLPSNEKEKKLRGWKTFSRIQYKLIHRCWNKTANWGKKVRVKHHSLFLGHWLWIQ